MARRATLSTLGASMGKRGASGMSRCGVRQRLFPYALVSLLKRKEREKPEAYLACPRGHLFEGRSDRPQPCTSCGTRTDPDAEYTPRRVATCPCGHSEQLEARAAAGLQWEVVLVERAATNRRGRELALPSAGELAAAHDDRCHPTRALGPIRTGQETAVLLRHGFRQWEDLYPRRQRAVVERLLELTEDCSTDPSVTTAC